MLTYAEELHQKGVRQGKIEGKDEGKTEGKIEGQVETIESLLCVGVDWALITEATGITPQEFDALKARLQEMADSPDTLPSAQDQGSDS